MAEAASQQSNDCSVLCYEPISNGSDPDEGVDAAAVMVPNGLGAPCGLEPEEHIDWATKISHPAADVLGSGFDNDMKAALDFECEMESAYIDEFRCKQMAALEDMAATALAQQPTWIAQRGLKGNKLAEKINGPLFQHLVSITGYDVLDPRLVHDIAGFPLIGALPPSGPDTQPVRSFALSHVSSDELLERRRVNNLEIVGSPRASEWDLELFEIALEDAEVGCSTAPELLTDWHMNNVTLCRRIPVCEERSKG